MLNIQSEGGGGGVVKKTQRMCYKPQNLLEKEMSWHLIHLLSMCLDKIKERRVWTLEDLVQSENGKESKAVKRR